MKRFKKILSLTLAILLVMAMLPSGMVAAAADVLYEVLLEPSVGGYLNSNTYGNVAVVRENIYYVPDAGGQEYWQPTRLIEYTGTGSGYRYLTKYYKNIGEFSAQGYAAAENFNNEWGIIDSSGNPLTDFKYRYIYSVSDDGYAVMASHDRWTPDVLLNLNNHTETQISQEWATYFSSGYTCVEIYNESSQNSTYHYERADGSWPFNITYDYAGDFSYGYAGVRTVGEAVYQIINTEGRAVLSIPAGYWPDGDVSQEGIFAVTNGNRIGYMDVNGNWIVSCQYSIGRMFQNGYAVVWDSNYNQGIIDTKGQAIIPFGVFYNLSNASNTDLVWNTGGENLAILRINSYAEPESVPIIYIPGIMGSELYLDEDCKNKLWFDTGNLWGDGDLRLDISNQLYTKGLFLEPADEKKREYGTQKTSKGIIDFLCDEFGQQRDIYFFSYDWRQSNTESAKDLHDSLKNKGIKQFDLVCHSMGGLVAGQYIASFGKNNISHIITLGTPYEGAPQLLQAVLTQKVLTGDILKWAGNRFLRSLTTEIKSKFQGVAELSPTVDYWIGTEGNCVQYKYLDMAESVNFREYMGYFANRIPENLTDEQLRYWVLRSADYANLVSTLKAKYKTHGIELYDCQIDISGNEIFVIPIIWCKDSQANAYKDALGSIFPESSDLIDRQRKIDTAINTLLNSNNAYFAIGDSKKTISGAILHKDSDDTISYYDCTYGLGDGTVPLASSEMMLNYCPRNAAYFDLEHGELANGKGSEWTKLTQWIGSILRSESAAGRTTINQAKPYIVIRVACPVDVVIERNGEILTNILDSYNDETSYGVMNLLGVTGEIKMFCLDKEVYDVSLSGTDTGTMDFAIRFFDANDNLYSERVVEDVPVTEDTIIYTDTDETGNTVLEVDSDGDGIIDDTIIVAEFVEQPTTNTYALTVINGTGGGDYEAGETVTITAIVPEGQEFTGWIVDEGNVIFADPASEETTFTMPASNVTVTATCEDIAMPPAPVQTYTVIVNGGTGGGDYEIGKDVTITAIVPEGKQFRFWIVNEGDVTLADPYSEVTTFTMPASDVTVTANYEDIATPPVSSAYTVTFDANGGTVTPTTMTTDEEGRLARLPVPVRDDYDFDGWFTAPYGGVKITVNRIFTEDTWVYAHWTYNGIRNPGGSTWYPSHGSTNTPPSTAPETYPVTSPAVFGGAITISPANAKEGDIVTVTVMPYDGYELAFLIATDSNGNVLELAGTGDGRYTFIMPDSAVTVNAVFRLMEQQPSAPTVPDWVNPFTDVSVSAWYYDAVKFVNTNSLMNGIENNLFAPDANLSRAQLAQILYNKEGRPAVSGGSAFTDVAASAWYSDAVTWAAANHIVGGYGNGLFGPDDNITREQLAVMLWRYAGEPMSIREIAFSDADQISDFAQAAIRWAVENGILNGKGNNILDPKGFATRAEVVQMLKNYLDN